MNHIRIDVHHHVLPPSYVAWLRSQGKTESGGLQLPNWSVKTTLDLMDRFEIDTGILSISTPGVCLRPGENIDEVRKRAREVNEFTAQLTRDYPDRFGFFATLTLPDIDGAIAEASYALDKLHASGVILLANTFGKYLGDPSDDPLFAELDRRRAVVFIHPSMLPGPTIEGIPTLRRGLPSRYDPGGLSTRSQWVCESLSESEDHPLTRGWFRALCEPPDGGVVVDANASIAW